MQNILLIKTSSLGDVVHNLPVVDDIRARYAGARIDWMVEEAYSAIVAMHPGVHRVIPVALRRWRGNAFKPAHWRELGEFRRAAAGCRYDRIIDTQGLIKSALLARAASGTRHGYARECAREPLAARFYDVVHQVARELHAVERNRLLVALALGYTPGAEFSYGISLTPAAASAAPYCVLLHATSRADKLWPEAAWVGLGQALASSGYAAVFPWGDAAEHERSLRLARAVPGAIVPARLDIPGIGRLLAGARAVIGVDTGLTHLAAALARPVIALYCGSDPGLTGVYAGPGAPARNLGGKARPPALREVMALLNEFGLGAPA